MASPEKRSNGWHQGMILMTQSARVSDRLLGRAGMERRGACCVSPRYAPMPSRVRGAPTASRA